MGIDRILGGLSGAGGAGEREPSLPKATTPTFVPTPTDTYGATKRGEQQFYGDYRRSMIEALLARQTQGPEAARQVTPAQASDEFKSVTTEQVRAIMLPHVREAEREKFEQNLEEKTKRLNEAMQEFGITKPLEQAMFLATISHESRGTMATVEEASKYASSKSVWKGSGDMQLTGPGNYRKASDYFQVGELIEKKNKRGRVVSRHWDGFTKNAEARALTNAPEWSSRIAGWYWTKASDTSKQISDKPADDLLDFRHASSCVNSGRPNGKVIGWSDRVKTYTRALDAFGIEVSPELAKNIEEQQKIANLPVEGKAHRAPSGDQSK